MPAEIPMSSPRKTPAWFPYITCPSLWLYDHSMLHCTLHRSSPTSFRKVMAIAWSLNRNVRNILFGASSSRSIPRPYENVGTNGIFRRRSSYCFAISEISSTLSNQATTTLVVWSVLVVYSNDWWQFGWRQALWVFHKKREGTIERNSADR